MTDARLVGGPWERLDAAGRERLDALTAALAAPGVVGLPTVGTLRPEVVARWAFRKVMPPGEDLPFLHLHTRHLVGDREARSGAPSRLGAALARAAGGVVCLEGAVDAGELAAAVEAHQLRVLVPDGSSVDMGPDEEAWALALDDLHAVAIDPALEDVRSMLAGLCASGMVVELYGPAGSGRRALATWAHAASGEGDPLLTLRGDDPPPLGAGWLLYENRETLGTAAVAHLRHQLDERVRRPSLPRLIRGGARPNRPEFAPIVGDSPAIAELLRTIEARAPVEDDEIRGASVFLRGETGSGKELAARALHALSGRKGPFVGVDLSTVPATLVTARLFGSMVGAYDGARDTPGVFEEAQGGTLLLDEIGNLSREVQQILLRVLQERVARRLGGKHDYRVDVRVISATSRDMSSLLQTGEFIPDLYWRLGGGPHEIRVPALRERRADIPQLARKFLGRRGITDAALRRLQAERWPGNVTMLKSVVQAAAAMAGRGEVDVEHLSVGGLPRPVILTASAPCAGEADLGVPLVPAGLGVLGCSARRAAVRRAVQAAVAPRPIDDDALAWLCGRPWGEGLREVRDRLAGLAQGPPGPVTLASIRRLFVEAPEPAPRLPILAVAMHSRGDGGRIEGLESAYTAEGLIIGRRPNALVAQWTTRPPPGHASPPTVNKKDWGRLVWLRERCGAGSPATLTSAAEEHLSAAHVLVTRDGSGLRVARLPDTHLPVRVVSVEDGIETELGPGAHVTTTAAARVMVSKGKRPLLDLYLFHGLEARSGVYLEEEDDKVPGGTRVGDTEVVMPPPPPPSPEVLRPRVWPVDDVERAALTRFLLGFVVGRETSLSAAIQVAVHDWGATPALARLGRFFTRDTPSARVTYLHRLLEYRGNRELREELAGTLAEAARDGHSLDELPGWLLALLGLYTPGEA